MLIPVPILCIISGGQTGADYAGLRAAKQLRLKTGGYMPKDFRTEAGPMPHYAKEYGMVETYSPDYQERTELNVIVSTGTVIFNSYPSPGSVLTKACCISEGRPYLWLKEWTSHNAHAEFRLWVERNHITTLNVAGSRESRSRGIEATVETFLVGVIPTCR